MIRLSAVMWQVVPCGQPPSRMTATPEIAAGFGDAGEPLRGGRAGSGGHHHRDGLRAAVAVGGAGTADDHGFGLIEHRVQRGRHQDAAMAG